MKKYILTLLFLTFLLSSATQSTAQTRGYQGSLFSAFYSFRYAPYIEFLAIDSYNEYGRDMSEGHFKHGFGTSLILGEYTEIEAYAWISKSYFDLNKRFWDNYYGFTLNENIPCTASVFNPGVRIKLYTRGIPAPLGLFLGLDLSVITAGFSYKNTTTQELENYIDNEKRIAKFKPGLILGYQRVFFDKLILGLEGGIGLFVWRPDYSELEANPEFILEHAGHTSIKYAEFFTFGMRLGFLL